jgi:hypothetical protein
MLEQGIKASPPHPGRARNQQPSSRHHEPGGDVLANADTRIERGAARVIGSGDSDRRLADRVCADHVAVGDAPRRDSSKDRARGVKQRTLNRAVEHQRRIAEVGGIAALEHRQLLVELAPLFAEQPFENGILNPPQVDRIEPAFDTLGIDGQRAVVEDGLF